MMKTTMKWSLVLGAVLAAAGCASQRPAPIEGIGPTSGVNRSQAVQAQGINQSGVLDSENLANNIHNFNQYTPAQQQAMMNALRQMPCQRVNFAFDSYQLTAEGKQCLDAAADYLKQYNQPISLAGNTDPRGSDKYNMNLGQRRADAAMSYLASQGVPASQMCAVSYGKLRPAADPKQFLSDFGCGAGKVVTQQCQEQANNRAWSYDRRTDLEFGLQCN